MHIRHYRKRLQKLADYLRNEVSLREFDMDTWSSSCGTTRCIAGHACKINPDLRLVKKEFTPYNAKVGASPRFWYEVAGRNGKLEGEPQGVDGPTAFARAYGLRWADAKRLCMDEPFNSPEQAAMAVEELIPAVVGDEPESLI